MCGGTSGASGINLADPDAELLDPTPDALQLFREYDALFFDNALQCVEVRWSQRMTLYVAGVLLMCMNMCVCRYALL
jgi:hypothetical protein